SFSNFTASLRVKDPAELDFEYLHRYLFHAYLSGTTEKMQSHSTGIRNLDMRRYTEMPIPLPPLEQQKQAVKKLSGLFAQLAAEKANIEHNLTNLDDLFASCLVSAFDNVKGRWEETTLSELTSDITDGDHLPPPKSKSGVPFITISDINKENREIDFSDTFFV